MRNLLIIMMMTYTNIFAAENFPYPQQVEYSGIIKPSHVTQDAMNTSVSDYYDWWKSFYVKESNGNTDGGGYYVKYIVQYNGKNKTVSEAHGYGMIIFALMAGHDVDAKKYYDGMYNIYDKHRSTINDNLMSWILPDDEDIKNDDDCASDGDMDIAYSLLLAHKQWGSDGTINYLSEAKRMITDGIKKSDNEQYGVDRLVTFFTKYAGNKSVDEMNTLLFEELKKFKKEQLDDITYVVFKRDEK